MNAGAFGTPAPRLGLISLGTLAARGSRLQWKNIPPGTRRLTMLLSRVSGTAPGTIFLRTSSNDLATSAGYLSVLTNLSAAAVASAQESTGFRIANVDAAADACSGTAVLLRDDFGNWVLTGLTSRYNVPGTWLTAGDVLASSNLSQDTVKLVEVFLTAGTFTGGTFTLFAELDASAGAAF